MGKSILVLFLAVSLISTPALTQQGETSEYAQGKTDGEQAARGNSMWFLAGCLLGLVGVMIAYVVEPDIATEHLVGRSPEYVRGFTEGYRGKAKKKNGKHAINGCATAVVVTVLLSNLGRTAASE